MKVLVLGCKGQLGKCLYEELYNKGLHVTYTSRDQIDITNFEDTKVKITRLAPDVIINASAYTNVDNAENEEEIAYITNHLAVKNLAIISFKLGCWLIHFSTDYVFDGKSIKPYLEADKTNPLGVYGLSKNKGELAIQEVGCKYLILRVAWLFSEYNKNFLKTILYLGNVKDELRIIGDQIGCPTYAHDLAKCTYTVLTQLFQKNIKSGIFHFCGDQPCSWYDFAQIIFQEAKLSGFKIPSSVKSIRSSDYPTLASRPLYSVLGCNKIRKTFGVRASNWKLGIKYVLLKIDKTIDEI